MFEIQRHLHLEHLPVVLCDLSNVKKHEYNNTIKYIYTYGGDSGIFQSLEKVYEETNQ